MVIRFAALRIVPLVHCLDLETHTLGIIQVVLRRPPFDKHDPIPDNRLFVVRGVIIIVRLNRKGCNIYFTSVLGHFERIVLYRKPRWWEVLPISLSAHPIGHGIFYLASILDL